MDSPTPPRKSGFRAALEYTGIPASWLSTRPRLPSRNWCIFIAVTSSFISYYAYDRHQARTIRQSYVDRVKHLADAPMKPKELPRKVIVYGAKWPGDEDHQRAIRFFRKYVKPVLVAAAVDYELVVTRHTGDLADRIASDVIKTRRLDLGIDKPPPLHEALQHLNAEPQRARELEGGVILVGRHTLKEYTAGLKRGWSGGLELVDKEENLARELASDGRFDEVDELDISPVGIVDDPDAEPIPTKSRLPPSLKPNIYSPLHRSMHHSSRDDPVPSETPLVDSTPPSLLPPHPPLLLVPSINYVGFRYIPHMIWDFFNERHKTHIGCEAGYSLIINKTREFRGPSSDVGGNFHTGANGESENTVKSTQGQPQGGDLDFSLSSESVLVPHSPLSYVASARESYYKKLPERLATARQLARGVREPTKEEDKNPPPSEVELRAERLSKELRWRGEEEGWRIVGPGSGVSWDERFRGVLRVFDCPDEDKRVESEPDSNSGQ